MKKMLLSVCFALYSFLTPALYSESNKVVLVTGGAGYIGSHTCKALKEAGFYPVVYDSLASGDEDAVKWGPLVIGNLLDRETLDQAFATYKPCAVIHFAALCKVGESIHDPSIYYTNNICGSVNLLNAMQKHGVQNIIFSSSCTVYGDQIDPISEESPKSPTNPYAKSKYFGEQIIKDYAQAYPMNYMILRYFNAAGVEVDAGLKRSPHSSGFLIPRILNSILQSEQPLEIFGSDYPTEDGTCVRDYIHVKDLARAHVLAMNHLQDKKTSDELNLGTGKGYSVLKVIHEIERLTDKTVPYSLKPRREGDVPHAVAKTEKAKAVLDFKAEYSDLQTIIQSEWEAIQKR